MVDVLTARMQALYVNWDQKPKTAPMKKVSAASFRSCNSAEKREKYRPFSIDESQQYRERELFRSKEMPWNIGLLSRSTRPLMGLACKACTPNSKDFSFDTSAKDQEVRNFLQTKKETSNNFLHRTFCHILHIWQFKKFDFPRVFNNVIDSNLLKEALHETTKELLKKKLREEGMSQEVNKEEMYKEVLKAQQARVKSTLIAMRSTLSDLLLRITTWLVYKLFPRFLRSVCLHPAQLQMIQKAAKTNLPLIFVPLHRSHLDYILITFVLQNIKVKSPLVAAGNNLKIPVFGWLLRGLGAFFIKRRIDPMMGEKDTLYRAVLQTYMTECLRAGHNIEFYIEGGRTRTGKPCMPKGGLLSVIVGAYMDGTVEDALLVPVSINYDKLVDGNFVSELLGQPKKMETFAAALSAIWTTLNSNYGSVRIDFNQPFSLREIVKSLQNKSGRLSQNDFSSSTDTDSGLTMKKNEFHKEKSFRSIPSTTSLYGTDVVDESHRTLVDKIGRHLIYDSSKACAVMATNSLAFLLLYKYRDGVEIKELVKSFEKLRQQLASDNKDVGFSGESEHVIEYAISLLGPDLVKKETKPDTKKEKNVEIITPVTDLPNVIGLSYYSNTLVTHFAVEGVVATAISCCIKVSSSGVYTASLDNIVKNAIDLFEIFQFEFIFAKPCETFEYVINEAIDRFKFSEILSTQENSGLGGWDRYHAKNFDDSEDDEFYQYKPSPTYIISSVKEDEEKFQMFHSIFRPYVDAYMTAALCLHKLVEKELQENEFLKLVLAEIKSQIQKGSIPFGESSSVELIKNAIKLFKKWGVVDLYSRDAVRLICLTESYNREDSIQNIIDKISFFKFYQEASTPQ